MNRLGHYLSRSPIQNKNADVEVRVQCIPRLANIEMRTILGLSILILSMVYVGRSIDDEDVLAIVSIIFSSWLAAVVLTHKYAHKYPQMYYSYVVASHLKATIVMGFSIITISLILGFDRTTLSTLLMGFTYFTLFDFIISLPKKVKEPLSFCSMTQSFLSQEVSISTGKGSEEPPILGVHKRKILDKLRGVPDTSLCRLVEENIPECEGENDEILILNDSTELTEATPPVSLLVCRFRINDLRRINRFLLTSNDCIGLGGYIIGTYVPLEVVADRLKSEYIGLVYKMAFILHFAFYRVFPKIPWLNTLYFMLTNGRNRDLSRAEVWGRLAYCGMIVVGEYQHDGEVHFVAQRVERAKADQKPSYYPIVALQKVGLNGDTIYTHKVRSMYPFSEFLQKRIFEEHGLTAQGKFSNDFRLTEYGPVIRKYWIDELPQLFDWLNGDLKLVGIRATSPHFLSLYPAEYLKLHIQVKPGLIPPVFDEDTTGFEQIVAVEQRYLESYWGSPFSTDLKYLRQTFVDIFLKGVRSN